MVNEPEMLLLTTCVLCSGILLSVCVFEIALGFCRPTHGCSGPTNGRRATLPNTNPSWDGFFPAHPLMLGADQREARHTPEHPPLLGGVVAGPPTDARGRPTGGGGGCGSSRHAPAFGQQLQFGLLHAQCRFGVAAF